MVQEIREGSTGLVVTIDEDMIHAAAQRKRWHSIKRRAASSRGDRIGGRRCAHSHELEELCVLITCQ
jgi:hypothetical protein